MTESEMVTEVYWLFAGLWLIGGGGAIVGAFVSLWTHPISEEWRDARRSERAQRRAAARD